MGLIDRFSQRQTNEYSELTESDLEESPNTSSIVFCDVRSQNDIVTAKEAISGGNIVIFDVSYIESNGLSLDNVYSEIEETTSSVNGDIVHKKGNDVIVAAPREFNIDRTKI